MVKSDPREDPVYRLSRIDTARLPADGGEHYNRLIFEKSPYLLQHAENPVGWYPWGDAAFARAAAEEKPVFLSIGYSTCHWCHVMAHECFEDREVADVLNRHFIAVKVDREERPDIDATYLATCQMMTGSGGWPANLVLTPEKKPFFAATYLPKHPRPGTAGLIQVLEKIAQLWNSDRSRLLHTGEDVLRALQRPQANATAAQSLREQPLQAAFEHYLETFDRRFAGFGPAPKFPAAHNLSLLFRIWHRTGDERAKTMALQTLQAIRMGGIYDQIGHGLHRYAVDDLWLVPHFEKMLYDQALTAQAALDAYLVTDDDFFAQTAREILGYVLRDLAAPTGGFTCGEDADSEGAEGTYYLWTPGQIREALGEDLGTVFCRSYGITDQGQFEGRSIPHLEEDIDTLAKRAGVDPARLADLLEQGRRQLLEVRESRTRPNRDDKILTGWNGLTIAALARAGAHLEEERFLRAARRSVDFVLTNLRDRRGRLLRRYCRGEAAIPAFLEDYAFFTWGLIELYGAEFETAHLKAARELVEQMEELFSDGRGGYFDTGADAERVLVRGQSLQDGAIPSGASVAALVLLRLGRLTGESALNDRGERLLRASLPRIARFPTAYSQFLMALNVALGPATEVVLASDDEHTLAEMRNVLRRRFLPTTEVLLYRRGDGELEKLAPAVAGKVPPSGRTIAFVCRERTCLEPVATAEELRNLLR